MLEDLHAQKWTIHVIRIFMARNEIDSVETFCGYEMTDVLGAFVEVSPRLQWQLLDYFEKGFKPCQYCFVRLLSFFLDVTNTYDKIRSVPRREVKE